MSVDMVEAHKEASRRARESTDYCFPDPDNWRAEEHYRKIYYGELGKLTSPPVNRYITQPQTK